MPGRARKWAWTRACEHYEVPPFLVEGGDFLYPEKFTKKLTRILRNPRKMFNMLLGIRSSGTCFERSRPEFQVKIPLGILHDMHIYLLLYMLNP